MGEGGDSRERQEALAGADRPQAPGGGSVAGRRHRSARRLSAPGGVDPDLPALALAVQGDAPRGGGPLEAAGEEERPFEAPAGRAGAGHRHVEGGVPGKLLTPERRRRAVSHLQGRFRVSERRACLAARQLRSSQRYQRRRVPDEAFLRERLRLLARRHPRYGYRRIHALLCREGWACNRKRVQRLWRGEGLRLPPKAARRRSGKRMPGHISAACPNQVWALDFLVDQTADGRPIKILTVTDEHTREALATPAARRITSDETVSTLEQVVERRGNAPAYIRCDNGPEFTAEALKDSCR